MKIILIGVFIFMNSILFSLELINSDRVVDLDRVDLNKFDKIEITTRRNKDGEEKEDNWVGVRLTDVLNEHKITDYDKLRFTSSDNYLVRVLREDISNNECILALFRNGKELSDEHIRLVDPTLRDMFWIQDIITIKTESISEVPFPHTIYFADPIIQKTQISDQLDPFIKVKGYKFSEIMKQIFPFLKDEVLIVGKDGVKHSLNYSKYLQNAVLVINDNSLDIKSPDMPAGMWIKDLAYVQIFDVAVIFLHQFKSLNDVKDLLGWVNFPDQVILHKDDKMQKISSRENFKTEHWSNAKWLEW